MSLPSTDAAKWVATLMHRRLTTHWNAKEIRAFRILVKQGCFENKEDLELLEQYYAFERKKGEKGWFRRDLYTLLNNFQTELDRATAWRQLHPIKREPRKVIPMPPIKSEPFILPSDPAELALLAKFEADRLARKQRREPAA